MSYNTISICAGDIAFVKRLAAAIADEGRTQPETLANDLRWPVASADDIEAAYASALAGGNENPGGDESVITDAMILGVVQANLPPEVE